MRLASLLLDAFLSENMNWKNAEVNNESIENKILEISDCLILSQKPSMIGIHSGAIGISIFLCECYRYFQKEYFLDEAYRIINDVLSNLNSSKILYSLCNGIAGLAWGLNYLKKQNFLSFDNDFTKSFDDQLYSIMLKDSIQGRFDFLHNAMGIGLYFLGKEEDKYDLYLDKFIDILCEKAEFEGSDTCKWRSWIDAYDKRKQYNLSMSHGITSVIMFLHKCYINKISVEKTLHLRNCSISFLLKQMRNSERDLFPSWVPYNYNYPRNRMAWCYGDLSIGYVLKLIADHEGNSKLKEISNVVLTSTLQRKHLKSEGVMDACFCHGTSGIAHIYNRLYNLTEDERYNAVHKYWIEKTLENMVNHDGIAGYKLYVHENYGGSQNSLGILEGVTGVGLVLLSSISEFEPMWDECLLLS